MIRSKLTTKSQTTIPRSVRKALRLEPGDEVAYRIEGNRVILSKAEEEPVNDPFAMFSEWHSDADHDAYSKL
jgi:antitoxin PrlF